MPRQLVECVPNFSEGRDGTVVQAIAEVIASVPGIQVLRTEMDPDHNRSVVTFAGPPAGAAEAAFQAIRKAAALIDLRRHEGVHPRIGAADVVPFVPLDGLSMENCAELAHGLGQRVWEELRIPVYFYESAALNPERVKLESIRRGGLSPDLGGPAPHPTAGATVIGARKFLIAYNINLQTNQVAIARAIARTIRESSGGFPHVKALGLPLVSRNLAQVSMNLTDFEQTPIHTVFEAVEREAARHGTGVAGSELIGLVPKKAFELAAAHFMRCENFDSSLVLENRLRFPGLAEQIAEPQTAYGPGSACASAGSLAAALGVKICRWLDKAPEQFETWLRFFEDSVERDAEAFTRLGSQTHGAQRRAIEEPLLIAETSRELERALRALPSGYEADLAAAVALAQAAHHGAAAVARGNLRQTPFPDLMDRLQSIE